MSIPLTILFQRGTRLHRLSYNDRRLISLVLLGILMSLAGPGCGMFADLPNFREVYCEANERVKDNLCVACPPGSTNEAEDFAGGDADTSCDPILCGENQRVVAHVCQPCALGTVTAAGADASGVDTTCTSVLCEENKRVESNVCRPCPAGTFASQGANAAGGNTFCEAKICKKDQKVEDNACVDCSTGQVNAAGDLTSGPDTLCDGTTCKEDQYVLANTCVACPIGTVNEAGDDASGEDTTCEPKLCPADQYVSSNTCVPCSIGTVNAPGDEASGADTVCDSKLCLADQYVSSNVCVPCQVGTTRPAGDKADGADTACGPVLCEVNQRVKANRCVPCDGTDLNEPGDDASGADTTCVPFGYKAVSAGGSHTCGLTVTGGVKCWGDNDDGKLGTGDEIDRLTPVDANGLTHGVRQIKAHGSRTCAVTENGELYCWGPDINYDGPNPKTLTPLEKLLPQRLEIPPGPVLHVDLSGVAACITVKDKENLYCWGSNNTGLLHDLSQASTRVLVEVKQGGNRRKTTTFSIGDFVACDLAPTLGSNSYVPLYCWGSNVFNMLASDKIVGNSKPVQVNVNFPSSSASLANSSFDVDVGRRHVCASSVDRNQSFPALPRYTQCWGDNTYGGLGDGTTDSKAVPTLVVRKSGVPSFGYVNYDKVECGNDFTCGQNQGLVECWGKNNAGQLGDGTTSDSAYAVEVLNLANDNVQQIDVGDDHACAVTDAGRIKCWGSNASGKLGDGTTMNRSTPVEVKM